MPKIITTRTNKREHKVIIDERDLFKVIAQAVARDVPVNLDHDHVDYRVRLDKKERPGLTGYEAFAEVIIIEDLSDYPEAG